MKNLKTGTQTKGGGLAVQETQKKSLGTSTARYGMPVSGGTRTGTTTRRRKSLVEIILTSVNDYWAHNPEITTEDVRDALKQAHALLTPASTEDRHRWR